MRLIREYLDMWHPEWYNDTFTDKETIECFQEVMGASLDELDPYLLTSTRWDEEFAEALDVFTDVMYEKYDMEV